MSEHEAYLQKARQSLLGLSVADAFGFHFEAWRAGVNQRYIKERKMPDGIWKYTDDTEMALSIYSVLRQFGRIEQDTLADSFTKHFDESRAYGTGAMRLLRRMQDGEDWRTALASRDMFRGEGSFGNGAAMRAGIIGAYFSDDIDKVIENAQLSAEITHTHPEGIAGAIAVAVAAAILTNMPKTTKPTMPEFFDSIISHIPESEVRENCVTASQISPVTSTDKAALVLGNGRNIAAMDTVPIAFWCAIKYLDNFEEAMWQLASIGGDVDTTCAITGSIIACYSTKTIPETWKSRCEELPEWAFQETDIRM